MGTKVTLRQKPISGNRQSLYLDFYPPIVNPETGKQTRREFLNLFLFDEYKHEEESYIDENGKPKKRILKVISAKTKKPIKVNLSLLDGKHNESTLQYASQIQQKKENSINKPEIYTGFEKEQLRLKEKGDLNFVEYFKVLSEKHKNTTDFTWIASYKYLEAFTGGTLKFSDIDEKLCGDVKKLVWRELEYIEGNGHFIKFTQQKKKEIEMMPISEQAYSLLGAPKQQDSQVFDGLVYSNYSNLILTNWVLKAGITKPITFHCFRHTFATLQLSAGTDIYTVSKMLGHRDLKTTQIYANVIDKLKRDASNRISLNF